MKELIEKIAATILNEVPELERGNFIREIVKIVGSEMEKTAEIHAKAYELMPKF